MSTASFFLPKLSADLSCLEGFPSLYDVTIMTMRIDRIEQT